MLDIIINAEIPARGSSFTPPNLKNSPFTLPSILHSINSYFSNTKTILIYAKIPSFPDKIYPYTLLQPQKLQYFHRMQVKIYHLLRMQTPTKISALLPYHPVIIECQFPTNIQDMYCNFYIVLTAKNQFFISPYQFINKCIFVQN